MINTSDFKTKTSFKELRNTGFDGIWPIALDIGYSSVKGISNNMMFCFPSYARKITNEMLSFGEINKEDILYRDNTTKDIWCVGRLAEEMIASGDTQDSNIELFGRLRYASDMFLVIARVGLGIGMMTNQYGSPDGKELMLQTGLPPKYMQLDTSLLVDTLAGEHDFSIKIGNKKWLTFNFGLKADNINVMAQPLGTLISIATDKNGEYIQDASTYLSSNALIFDAGFGTLDIYSLKKRIVDHYETFQDYGMKRVLEETSKGILDKYQQEFSVTSMQKYLSTGEIKKSDKKTKTSEYVPFGDILEDANHKVCSEALRKINSAYNDLYDYDYLIITGGTGAAWLDQIKEEYAGMETIKIVEGNKSDETTSPVFANVRGYYNFLLLKLKKMAKDQAMRQNITKTSEE